jgi:REP element-mobilizing transposase RayT
MGWILRLCGEDLYHHIYAWGNDRHPVFKADSHYLKYLIFLEKHALDFDVDIIAYAMMEYHVHLFVYDRFNNLSNFMMKLHGDYARFYNGVNERVGHVFGERFNNKIVAANIYGKWLSRYIHRQAVEAGLVQDPADFPWTSYRVYMGLENRRFIKSGVILDQFGEGNDQRSNYRSFVLSKDAGPVDWSKRYFSLIKGDDLIHYICQKMDLDASIMKNPRGARERQLRHNALRELHASYGYKASQLARVFGLSRSVVARILKE